MRRGFPSAACSISQLLQKNIIWIKKKCSASSDELLLENRSREPIRRASAGVAEGAFLPVFSQYLKYVCAAHAR